MGDGDVVVCQSNAVLEYLGDRFGLSGGSMHEKLLNKQALCEIFDLHIVIETLAYIEDETEFKEKVATHCREGHRKTYDKLEAFLKQNGGPYSCGEKVCAADFPLFELLDQVEIYAAKCEQQTSLSEHTMLAT